ncbi:hypothetical protein QZH41_009790 [Actinostola sp. cb2023]|nr:hypothetical protein QZH41_009790 [Actinostola sp. cb2023]
MTAFDAAMMDPRTGLTHAALTGERKQSVVDAERMLSFLVSRFLSEHGYIREAHYVNTVAGWHEAADGRGVTELERCRKNYAMLNMVLDEWMPWHNDSYNFSLIDINRPVKGICGFSRETVIAVTTNIESIEYRRRQNLELGYEEHPRAGTTDDVEAIFALFHRFLGKYFYTKGVQTMLEKSCEVKEPNYNKLMHLPKEFCKRMDKDLPFYYWTANERYRDWEEILPSFNERPDGDDDEELAATDHPLRLHRLTVNRREDASVFTAGRSFLPARNQATLRQRLHRPVVDPPPPPN